MKSQDGLAVALALVSNKATLTFAQYVTTVTEYVNTNPFCTLLSGIEASGLNGGGAGGAGFGPGSGYFNASGNGTSSATNATASIVPINATAAQYGALGYYATPANGNLLGGPIFTSPLMTVDLCNTDCQGYSYFALENGDECNCGSSAPTGTPSSSPPSKNKRQVTSGGCTPCAGNSAECCGAPGYALVYHVIPDTKSSSVVVYSTTSSASPFVSASSTSSFPTSSSTTISYASIPASSSASTYNYTTTTSPSSITGATSTTSIPIAPVSAGFGLGPASGNGSGFNPGSGSVFGNGTGSSTSFLSFTTGFPGPGSGYNSSFGYNSSTGTTTSDTATIANGGGSSTPTTNGGATTTTSGGAEPTVESPTPSCVSSAGYVGNNTRYSDYFGYTYDIRCNLNLESTPTDDDAHAESFEDCLEYCSLLTDCVAVNYQDPPSINSSNCYPKWSFDGYTTSAVDGLYSGVNVNGPSPGTLENQNLCTSDNTQGSSYDGSTYYDDFGTAWNIGCNDVLVIPTAAALSTTVADTLASCVDYCSVYDSCDMVNWTGPHTNGTLDDPNCFPASSNGSTGAADSAPGSAYALLSSD